MSSTRLVPEMMKLPNAERSSAMTLKIELAVDRWIAESSRVLANIQAGGRKPKHLDLTTNWRDIRARERLGLRLTQGPLQDAQIPREVLGHLVTRCGGLRPSAQGMIDRGSQPMDHGRQILPEQLTRIAIRDLRRIATLGERFDHRALKPQWRRQRVLRDA